MYVYVLLAVLLPLSVPANAWSEAPKQDRPPAKTPASEKKLPLPGEVFQVEGHEAFVIMPGTRVSGRPIPWVWYAPTLPPYPGPEERWMFESFLAAGIAVAGIDVGESYGSPDGRKLYTALYRELTQRRDFARKPVMLGRSRGGLMTLCWAEENADKVAGFAGIYPVCNIASYPGLKTAAPAYHMSEDELRTQLEKHNPIDRLARLAKARVPLFAVHGDVDKVVPLELNSGLLKERYDFLGGQMQLVTTPGQGHNMWSGFFQCQELVDFIIRCAKQHDKNLNPAITSPLSRSTNPNYFADASGKPIVLCGSQTWNTLQDWGTNGRVRPLDFDRFVRFLNKHGHNFTLLWTTELPKFHGLPTTESSPQDFTVSPFPWMRTGPGLATDGGLKFDLTKFNPEFFSRLRSRVQTLLDAGIYVSVYPFTGEWLLRFRCSSDGYPFSGPNNVNGVDDGYQGGTLHTAVASVTMTAPSAITDYQDAFLRKMVDTLNDLPNVLWIVSEEAPPNSLWWNKHLISVIRNYEKGKLCQHPIGYATLDSAPDSIIYNSDADWVAPAAWLSPTRTSGAGNPPSKVNINDSDHSYFGMWNDTQQKNRAFAWQNFTNGNQVLFMDPYVVYYPRQGRNLCAAPIDGIGSKPDARWENFRKNLGYILRYSRKLNLSNVAAAPSLSSTKCCLAQTPAAGAEYLVYAPAGGEFTVDLSAMPNSRLLNVEWFNPATGTTTKQNSTKAGSTAHSFQAPFAGDAVLYLVDSKGHP